MTFLEAAYKILKEKKKPLHYTDITKIAIEKGLIETEGRSPELTMHSLLSMDIKVNGSKSLFKKEKERGFFSLRSLRKDILNLQLSLFRVAEQTDKIKNSNLFIGKAGEYIVAGELLFRGFNATILPVDVGIDIMAEKKNKIFNIQVKTSNSKNSRYNFNIRVSSFEKTYSNYTFYVFVLRENKKYNFIILPYKKISKWIKNKLIKKTTDRKYYLVPIVERGQKYYLRNEEISLYLNKWKLMDC